MQELIDLGAVRLSLVEIPLMGMHEDVRTIRPGCLDGARVELKYPAPEHAAVYPQWYGCPVAFNAPRNALIIPAAWRAVHNMGYDEGTWNTSRRQCEVLCAITEEKDTLTRVRRMLFNRFEQAHGPRSLPSLEEVAVSLHLSPRTVIRRLRDVDTTYQAVVDGVQQQRARELLGNPNLRIQDIAVELGYQDPNSFARSFKRWFAMPPDDYRRRVGSGDLV